MKSRWLCDALELVLSSSADIFVSALHLPFNSELHLATFIACSEIFSRTKIITGSAKCLSKFVCVRFEIARVMNQRRSAPFFAVSNVNTCELSGSEQKKTASRLKTRKRNVIALPGWGKLQSISSWSHACEQELE